MKKRGLLILVVGCLALFSAASLSCRPKQVRSMRDINKQLTKQFRDQLTKDVYSVEVTHFERQPNEGNMVIRIRIHWDKHNSKLTAMTLYPVADKYYVGTFELTDDPAVGKANVVLCFP